MKVFFSVVAACLVSISAQAHRLESVRVVTNPLAQAVLDASDAIHAQDRRYTASVAYKIQEAKPARKEGESSLAFHQRILKHALHRDYPITGDEGGYDFSQFTADNARKEIPREFRDYHLGEISSDDLERALEAAANDASLIVLMGTGSGNNTTAHISAVIDSAHGEIVYFISSNFGSDS